MFLVDDHPIIRRGLRLLLNTERDLIVCGEADGATEAFNRICELQPDLAVVDISLKEGNGVELVQRLRERRIPLKILVFTMHSEAFFALRVTRAGADAFLAKEEGTEKLVHCVRALLDDPRPSAQPVTRMASATDGPADATSPLLRLISRLSNREMEILEMIGRGLSTRQVAERLRLNVRTVDSHREHIKRKLGLRHAPEVAYFAWCHFHPSRPA